VRARLFAVVAAATLVLSACGGASPYVRGMTPQQKAQARGVPVLRETLPDGAYRLVKHVQGVSCRVNAIDNDRVSEEEAIEELQYATLKAGATAVMEVRCDRPSFTESQYACAESVVCKGVAIIPLR
jgi:uncharacterized protein YbjQ (UPF0145 family)